MHNISTTNISPTKIILISLSVAAASQTFYKAQDLVINIFDSVSSLGQNSYDSNQKNRRDEMNETEYLMSSKANYQRIMSDIKSKKSITYQSLEELKRVYKL